jgi:hypothetical protein
MILAGFVRPSAAVGVFSFVVADLQIGPDK